MLCAGSGDTARFVCGTAAGGPASGGVCLAALCTVLCAASGDTARPVCGTAAGVPASGGVCLAALCTVLCAALGDTARPVCGTAAGVPASGGVCLAALGTLWSVGSLWRLAGGGARLAGGRAPYGRACPAPADRRQRHRITHRRMRGEWPPQRSVRTSPCRWWAGLIDYLWICAHLKVEPTVGKTEPGDGRGGSRKTPRGGS